LAAKAPTQPGPVTRSKTDRGPQPAPDPATPKQQPSPSKSPVPPPPPPPPPQAPPSVTETAQSGSILVTFTPVGGGGARDYALTGAPGSASIAPQRIPGSGSAYRFTVTGLNCGTQYRFSVTANYPSGSASTTASAGARPCVVPGAPGNLRFDNGTQHQIGVAWDAPGNDGGASVHYDVAWGGGRHGGITGTGYTITGLTNFRDYTVSVAAVNPAGSSQPPATGSVGLRPGTWGGTIGNNQLYPVNVRQQPDTGSPIVHQFPAGGGQSVTVICETDGGAWRDPTGSPSGSTWYRISGPSGYVATAYVNTSSGVWSCS